MTDAGVADVVEVRRGLLADLESLEPLWLSVHRRHAEAMPELAPYVSDEQSWAVRRALYTEQIPTDLDVPVPLRRPLVSASVPPDPRRAAPAPIA